MSEREIEVFTLYLAWDGGGGMSEELRKGLCECPRIIEVLPFSIQDMAGYKPRG